MVEYTSFRDVEDGEVEVDGFADITLDSLRRELTRLGEETLKPELTRLRSNLRCDLKEEMQHLMTNLSASPSNPRTVQPASLTCPSRLRSPSISSVSSPLGPTQLKQSPSDEIPARNAKPLKSWLAAKEVAKLEDIAAAASAAVGNVYEDRRQSKESVAGRRIIATNDPSPSRSPVEFADPLPVLRHGRGYKAGKEMQKLEGKLDKLDGAKDVVPTSPSVVPASAVGPTSGVVASGSPPANATSTLPGSIAEAEDGPYSSPISMHLPTASPPNGSASNLAPGGTVEEGQLGVMQTSDSNRLSSGFTSRHGSLRKSIVSQEDDVELSPFHNPERRSRQSRVLKESDSIAMFQYQEQDLETVADVWHYLRHLTVRGVVESSGFEYFVVLLVLANALMIGIQTDIEARNGTEEEDLSPVTRGVFFAFDKVFAILFVWELSVRLFVYRCSFFTSGTWKWNLFDFLVVALQIVEEVFGVIAAFQGKRASSPQGSTSFDFLRVMRILRLVRIVRLVRVLRLISELRTIVDSIIGSMRSLCWTLVLLLLLIYMIGVYVTQAVADHRADLEDLSNSHDVELKRYYGSLTRTVLSLFQSMTGGVDWDQALNPLVERISPIFALLYSIFIAFAVFAFMNIITGVFVEAALKSAHDEQDVFIVHHARQLFQNCDRTATGKLSWETFHAQLQNPEMETYFRLIDVDVKEAEGLFKLLDMDESGEVDYEEFLDGCLRLRGTAKAIDLITVMVENRKLARKLSMFSKIVENNIAVVYETLVEFTQGFGEQFLQHVQSKDKESPQMPSGMPLW